MLHRLFHSTQIFTLSQVSLRCTLHLRGSRRIWVLYRDLNSVWGWKQTLNVYLIMCLQCGNRSLCITLRRRYLHNL